MKALITGASSGIGKDMAKILSTKGYDLILVARSEKNLMELKNSLKTNCTVIPADLSVTENCFKLYEQVKDEDIDILINNAGYGLFGEFAGIDTEKEINMINLNIQAINVLLKLFLPKFIKRDKGHILNVASSAAFTAGPLMVNYYASKAYLLRVTEGIYEELRRKKSNVHISALCPGPVRTGFDNRAGVRFTIKGQDSMFVAQYAINKMFKNKLVIIPSVKMKLMKFAVRLVTDKFAIKLSYHIQKRKE